MIQILLTFILLLTFTACTNDKTSDATNDSKDNNFTIIRGTVPGTFIKAICDDNKVFTTYSNQNGTNEHPFTLEIESNLNCELRMTTNESSSTDFIITTFNFIENGASGSTFKGLAKNINLGHINLPLDKLNIIDADNDSIVDTPYDLPIVQYVDVLDVDNSGSIEQESYPLYDNNTAYIYLDRVTFNGENFEAKEATQGNEPDYTQTGKWKPLSFSKESDIPDAYNATIQYHYPNRVLYFNVVYQAKFDTINNTPSDLNTSHWDRLGEI